MKKCLALVLGGGGARGALQVGACRALFEAGYRPDLIVGTSIGAANAVALALWGVNLEGVAAMEKAYQVVAESQMMDTPGRLVWHALSGRPNYTSRRAKDLLVEFGIKPDLRFDQIKNLRLGLISADMVSGRRIIHGLQLDQLVLEGVLASVAVPPWFTPIENENQIILDGGALSNLPIEPALAMGATEIIALDLQESSSLSKPANRLSQLEKIAASFIQHETDLEFALAEARGVPVHHLRLRSSPPTPMWDFSTYRELIASGYQAARNEIQGWEPTNRSVLKRFSLHRIFSIPKLSRG